MDNNLANQSNNEALSAEKLLSERPSFSIRFRIIVAFLLAFLFSFGITITSMFFILRLDVKQKFLEEAANFSTEIQEARRYEKNFFLYGTKGELYEALNNIDAASKILQDAQQEMGSVLNPKDFNELSNNLNEYNHLLNQLASKTSESGTGKVTRDLKLEEQLRFSGHRILLLASNLVKKEREKVRSTAHTFTIVAIFSLVVNFIVMIWLATELTRQILQPLGRAVGYTQRIATGDFSPVTPKRPYRDEFSNLAIAINHMIRELQEKQDQLVQSRKMAAIGTLTSGIAHELNNPLNNISIIVEALLEDLEEYPNEQKRKMLKDIFIECGRASGTVKNLLDFTRVDEVRVESIVVEELIGSALRLVNNELLIKRIEVETAFADHTSRIRGNFRDFQQVFVNLFLNSIQAMPDGGKLEIHTHKEKEKHVRVDVTDNGCGIPEKNLSKVFDPFFTTKEEGKGTGLGLSVSYSIIQKIGGSITVDSELGKWTTFHLDLPVDEETS